MISRSRLLKAAAVLSLLVSTAFPQQDGTAVRQPAESSLITAKVTSSRVRFTAPSTVVQMRLEVYGANGEKHYDNELKGGNVLDYLLQNGQAEPLTAGSYLFVVTTKNLSGKLSQKIATLSVDEHGASLKPVDTTQLTARQMQSVGPVEEDSGLTILQGDEPQTSTVIAHNGEEGQITRGKGALSFRLGDFYSGNDREQMRLSEQGNLGIGVADPQARLDVDGFIRATQGIVFPDGSIQFSASKKTYGPQSAGPGQFTKNLQSGREHFETAAAGTGTQNFIAKWTETGGAGTLGNSIIFDNGTNVGISTASPAKKLDVRGGQIALDNSRFLYSRRTNGQFQEAFGIDSNDDIVFNRNSLVPGVDIDAPKASSALIFGTGAGRFMDIRNSANSVMLRAVEATGNIGIGTTNPTSKLEIAAQDGLKISGFQPFLTLQDANAGGRRSFIQGVNGDLAFIPQSFAGSAAAVVIKDFSGNVGIGTNNPVSKLQINGAGQFNAPEAARFDLFNTTAEFGYFQHVLNDRRWQLATSSGATVMVAKDNGNVGIGTTDPQARLQVAASNIPAISASSQGNAVIGLSTTPGFAAVYGENTSGSSGYGVYGKGGSSGNGVFGEGNTGVRGQGFYGVFGTNLSAIGSAGVYGESVDDIGWAGFFAGDVKVTESIVAAAGFFGGLVSADEFIERSDRNVKANFASVDTRAILQRLAAMPIQTWNFKSQPEQVRHIGPMAQDFRAAFNLGRDDKHISTIDADGVALAAIQGLYRLVMDKEKQIEQLQSRVKRLERTANKRRTSKKPASR